MAIFVAVCMVLMAASLGALLFLAAGLPAIQSAIVALAALICLVLYNAVSTRLRDRTVVGDQIADLSKGTSDLARQVAEMSRRLQAMEERVESTVEKARGVVDPITAEMGELGGLMKQLAETVAIHDARLKGQPVPTSSLSTEAALPLSAADIVGETQTEDVKSSSSPTAEPMPTPMPASGNGRFRHMSRESVIAMISGAVEAHRVDLYLQPIVTLPQRKVRYYEAVTRLRTPDNDVVPAEEFIEFAELGGVMPRIDNLLLFRCVQVVRRLLLKNRDVGLFCNVSLATLTDPTYFRQFHDFMQANRALANSLMFEFRQSDYRQFSAIEHEALSALSDLGFRFSLDRLTDLRVEPRELFDRGFRFMKVPARLLLNKATSSQVDIDPADLASLLARTNIDLIADRIENEGMVVDLLDFDVKFGQGFLFSPPRPVRPEALHGGVATSPSKPAVTEPAGTITDVAGAELPAVSKSEPAPTTSGSLSALAAPDFVRQDAPAA
jgi:cyclic-di-GMP phosphodiesterase TipF (flagellum assembly factor)